MEGLWATVQKKDNKSTYQKMTIDEMQIALKNLCMNRPETYGPVVQIFTGKKGRDFMELHNTITSFGFNFKYHIYEPSRIPNKFYYVSLFSKHGLYKLKVNLTDVGMKYTYYHGTKEIGKSNDLFYLKRIYEQNNNG